MDESRRLVGGAHRGLSVANHGSIVQGSKKQDNIMNGDSSAAVPQPPLTVEGNGVSSHAEVRAAATAAAAAADSTE